MSEDQFTVHDLATESRYVLRDNESNSIEIGEESYVDVSSGDVMERVLFHTSMSEEYAGQGLASVLVQQVIDDVIARGYRIVPVCPYVDKWLTKHQEFADHVTHPQANHLSAIAAQLASR